MKHDIPAVCTRLGLLCLAGLIWAAAPLTAAAAEVRTARVPGGGIHPQAAVDARGRIHLVYFEGDPMHGDAYYVRSDDGGRSFTKPIRANSHPSSVVIAGTVRGPHLAIGKGGRVHVAWMGSSKAMPKAPGKATPMLYARMNDSGDGFEAQRNLIQQHPGLDGGGSIAADGRGSVYVAWHAPADTDAHGEEARRVWLVRSRDDGRTFDAETAVDPKGRGCCACCGMRVFAGNNSQVLILYRAATEMVNRNMLLLTSGDGGRTFAVANEDKWEVAKCPMSTSAFAATSSGAVLAACETPEWKMLGRLVWQAYDSLGKPIGGQAGRAAGLPAWGVPAAVALPDGSFLVIY